MVKGIEIFRDRFRAYEGAFVLIGGAACDAWFTGQGLAFRATKDLDIVLLIEMLDPSFVAALRQFIEDGGYEIRQRNEDGPPILYRFAKPTAENFPQMLELFTRKPELLALGEDQQIVPVAEGEDTHSLSAILLNDDYYGLIRNHLQEVDGIAFATATALIPLKARAWLDLTSRRQQDQKVDRGDIAKHRTDVFRLAGTLPLTPGPLLPEVFLADLTAFLANFPEDSAEWDAIISSLKPTFGGSIKPSALRSQLAKFFRIG